MPSLDPPLFQCSRCSRGHRDQLAAVHIRVPKLHLRFGCERGCRRLQRIHVSRRYRQRQCVQRNAWSVSIAVPGRTLLWRSNGRDPIPVPCDSTFLVTLDRLGALVFATYLGGSPETMPSAIAFDPQGNVCVAGTAQGAFPVTTGEAFTSRPNGQTVSFIAKLNSGGTQLEYATYIPANIYAL